MTDEKYKEYWLWRGVEYPCDDCQGSGKKTYGSTATFWGGIGGAAMTTSVCNKCWGSGDKSQPWKSWKETAAELQEQAPLYERLRISVLRIWEAKQGIAVDPKLIDKAWDEINKIFKCND